MSLPERSTAELKVEALHKQWYELNKTLERCCCGEDKLRPLAETGITGLPYEIKLIRADGKVIIILFPDGTWRYV